MDLAKQAKIVDGIHDTLNDFVGQRLKVRANMGRSKIVESEGVLTQVHPQLFIMEVDRKRGRTARQSYQYVDVLTGMVISFIAQGHKPEIAALLGSFVHGLAGRIASRTHGEAGTSASDIAACAGRAIDSIVNPHSEYKNLI